MLHSAASRVGALDLGFVPGAGGLTAAQMAEGGKLDVVFLLGADEIEIAPGAFVVYLGTHGDRGAHRADVILPGAAYPEKSGLYVNTEGRVQLAARATFPPGEAREDWAILRALSDVLGQKLPYDSLGALREAMVKAHPHLGRIDQIAPGDPADLRKLAALGGATDKAPFAFAGRGFLPDQSDRAGVRGDGRVLGDRGRPCHADGGGVTGMAEFWSTYIWPLIVMVAQSVLLLVILLIAVAYVIYADRKIWAAVQMRRGPNVVGPWGLLQSFADLLKFVLKEPVIPASANKGVFLLAPLVTCVLALAAWAVIPVSEEWVIADINVGHPLHLRDLLAQRVRHHHGRLGVELEISVPGGAALGGADGVLRGLDRLRHHHRAAVRGLAQPVGDRRGAERQLRHVQLVLAAAACRCS